MKYNIVLVDNEDFVLASCPSLEVAKRRLNEMYKTDEILAKAYNWKHKPKYKIIEEREELI